MFGRVSSPHFVSRRPGRLNNSGHIRTRNNVSLKSGVLGGGQCIRTKASAPWTRLRRASLPLLIKPLLLPFPTVFTGVVYKALPNHIHHVNPYTSDHHNTIHRNPVDIFQFKAAASGVG
ncbi:hypothetical protein FRB93_006592 [Tulasnella sp. JGI-2019a]|nr:hypothetical protein FRB93_006592 [Tulasnella sp. JGI-2019a]